MFGRSNRSTLLALSILPAFAFGPHVPGMLPVGTFFYACTESPFIIQRYPKSRPAPPSYSLVEVYDRGKPPARTFERVGDVRLVARGSRAATSELTHRAILAARLMGGDALVDVYFADAAKLEPKAGESGALCLTASVVRWQ